MDDHCCRGRSRNSEGGTQGTHLHPQSGDANEKPGRVVLDPRTLTPIQSLSHLFIRLGQPGHFGCSRPPRAVGCVSKIEVLQCCGRSVELRQGGCWGSQPLPSGKHFPLSYFPLVTWPRLSIETDYLTGDPTSAAAHSPVFVAYQTSENARLFAAMPALPWPLQVVYFSGCHIYTGKPLHRRHQGRLVSTT